MTEEKDYIEIGTQMPMDVFSKELAVVMSKFQKLYKPYDEPCARLDFSDKIESMEKENERRNGYVKVEELKVDLKDFDFDKYADDDRFVLVDDQEDVTEKFIQGTRTKVILGHTLSYRCKNRGHGVAISIPMADYEKLKIDKPKPKFKDEDKGNVDLVEDKKRR